MTTALQKRVLVLNKSWQAIDVTTAKNAICKIYQDIAQVLDTRSGSYTPCDFDAWLELSIETWADAKTVAQEFYGWLSGINFKFMVPEIIVLRDYNGYNKREVKFSRRNIFERDKYTCQYCGKKFQTKELTIDHIIPKSRGGRSLWNNVTLACYKCNRRKDNRTPKEANMRLLKKAGRPHWTEIKTIIRGDVPESWHDFLGDMYWNIRLKD